MLFREVAMAVLFWDVNVFDDDALFRYRNKLLKEDPSFESVQSSTPEKVSS